MGLDQQGWSPPAIWLPHFPASPLRDPSWETHTFTSVQDTILPSDDTEKKLRLWSMSSFCHLTCNVPHCELWGSARALG